MSWWMQGVSEAPKDLDIEIAFENNVYSIWFERLLEYLDERRKQFVGTIHVTDIVYPCPRRGYYNAFMPPNMRMSGVMFVWMGIEMHKFPFLEHSELNLSWEGISGTVDEYEKGLFLDIKTTRNPPLYYNRKRKEKVITIRDHHLTQLEYYRVLLEKNDYPVESAGILYIDVNDGNVYPAMAQIHSRELDKIEEEMLDRKNSLEFYLTTRHLPPRDMSIGWMCKKGYCPNAYQCYKNVNPVDYLKPEYVELRWSTLKELLDEEEAPVEETA